MKNKMFFIFFMIIWILIVVLNIFAKNEVFSEQENRFLAKIPIFSFEGLVEGEYAEGLDTYINDHFIWRNSWLKLNSLMQKVTGKKEINGVYLGKDSYLFEKYTYGEEEQNNMQMISDSVNGFAKEVNIPIYFMLVPNSSYVYREKLPNNVELYNQEEIINIFYEDIQGSVETINVIETLEKNKDNNNLYFKTDHHMTSYGTYLLYNEFCKSAKLNIVPLSDFRKEIVSTNFLGTLDSKAQVFNQKADEMYVYLNNINQNIEGNFDGVIKASMFDENYIDKKDKYSYFLNGNTAVAKIKTKINNGKKLLVIKDSYAHIMAQFICQNYEEVHFIDPRYYRKPISEYIEENNIDEALFLYNVSNMITDIYLRTLK